MSFLFIQTQNFSMHIFHFNKQKIIPLDVMLQNANYASVESCDSSLKLGSFVPIFPVSSLIAIIMIGYSHRTYHCAEEMGWAHFNGKQAARLPH